MKYKLVKFKDGRYGARKGWFMYEFLDLETIGFTWLTDPNIIKYCKGTKERASFVIAKYPEVLLMNNSNDCKGTRV